MRRRGGLGLTYSPYDTSPAAAGPTSASMVSLPTTTNAGDIFARVATGAQTYYSTIAQIDAAKLNRQLLKAQGQAAVATAKAQGQNQAQTALVGLPSPSLLVVGGLALAAILILKR